MTEEAAWLTDGEQRTWRAFLALYREVMVRSGREMQAASQLSGADYEVLVTLSESEQGRLRPYELVEQLQWEQSRLSHQVRRMESRGLVAREDCPSDARGSVIALTPHGRETIEEAAPLHVASVRRLVFDHLSAEQVAALEDVATTVLDGLEAEEPIAACQSARQARSAN